MAYIRPPNTVIAGRALSQNPPPTPLDPAGVLQVNIDANIASKTELGVVQIGDNIDITPDGVISVTFPNACQKCSAIVVDSDYFAQESDYYVGVKAEGPVKIYLPEDPHDCFQLVVKADMGPPLGNKKVTIIAQGSNTIDDEPSVVLTVPYESVTVLSQGGNWHKI